ncbi:hypothetical protein DYU05_09145 [Mucilaginibacter terrenus]|uniref:Uncharacterized protein n=2 Tax=Mucilaginibacter terrenus TaxID=2482727 RepID=A0A3E2NYK0_9SPHI|nr:hypothetical protein DYU05_09145 [Mucilaginibacter terrenus]
MHTINYEHLMRRTRLCIGIVIFGLFISGVTAFPLETELKWMANQSNDLPQYVQHWLDTVYGAIKTSNNTYPFLSYGTDWLAFAHVMLAVLFIGPWLKPLQNIWVVQFGMIACVMILPLAFIMGPIRGIPIFWSLVDCSFGVLGIIPLYIAYDGIKKLAVLNRRGL